MTTKYLATDIAWDEAPSGVPVLKAYGDPLTGAAPWTIGLGSIGPDIGPDTVWTTALAFKRRDDEIRKAIDGLSQLVTVWRQLSDERQDVLVNMAYQMGVQGVMGFKNTLALIAAGQWAEVGKHMRDSLWHRQTPGRAERLAVQMETGVRAPRPYDNTIMGAVPVSPPKEGIMSVVSSFFNFVFDHTFAANARAAATADPNAVAAGIAAVAATPMPSEGSVNSPAGVASAPVKAMEDGLNDLVMGFIKTTIDQIPGVGGVAEVTGLDEKAAEAAKAMLVLAEQHALTYLSALFSHGHAAVNAATAPSNGTPTNG